MPLPTAERFLRLARFLPHPHLSKADPLGPVGELVDQVDRRPVEGAVEVPPAGPGPTARPRGPRGPVGGRDGMIGAEDLRSPMSDDHADDGDSVPVSRDLEGVPPLVPVGRRVGSDLGLRHH